MNMAGSRYEGRQKVGLSLSLALFGSVIFLVFFFFFFETMTCVSEVLREEVGRDKGRKKKKGGRGDQVFCTHSARRWAPISQMGTHNEISVEDAYYGLLAKPDCMMV